MTAPSLVTRLKRHPATAPALIALTFAVVVWMLMMSAPKSQRQRPEAAAITVEAIALAPSDIDVSVKGQGVVGAAVRQSEVRPQVAGQIVSAHGNFAPGGLIPAGEAIITIDPRDYDLALADAEAALAQARANVAIERGQQVIAQEEFALLSDELEFDAASRALALRGPQLARVEAELKTAEAAVERAKLNLERTRLTLPYDVVIVSVDAAEGEIAGARDLVGVAARADAFWVEIRVRQDRLARLVPRNGDAPGSPATITANGVSYQGEVVRVRADLAAQTRLGGALIAVRDPLSLTPENAERTPLLMGAYVSAEIAAGLVRDVVAVPRRALQDNNTVLVADADDTLQRRNANVVWELEDTVLLRADFPSGDRLIVSRLSAAAPGAALRVQLVDPQTGAPIQGATAARTGALDQDARNGLTGGGASAATGGP
ncbi:MAG: HlyD family efflux transporter periplasmic adaptor subunit [Pseudomonadota bacterium]